jgi:cytoskeletal protein RodZ
MSPQETPPALQPEKPSLFKSPKDPTRASRSLAIAMVFSVVFLIIAVGIIVWLFTFPRNPVANQANTATEDVRDVKDVSFVTPADLPAQYTKNDQSTVSATHVYYYDDATNCGFTVGVADVQDGKSTKDSAVEVTTKAQAEGVSIAGRTDGDTYDLKDADDAEKTYQFESVSLEQDVNVPGVAFNKQSGAVLYKQFGAKIASLSYACKAETWTQNKAELATLVSKFTVKTER